MRCLVEGCPNPGKSNNFCPSCYKKRMAGRKFVGGRSVLSEGSYWALERKKLQEDSILTASNKNSPITETEIETFVNETKDIQPEDSKLTKELYRLAKGFKRTLGAMEWWYKWCWRKDYLLNENFTEEHMDSLMLEIVKFEEVKTRLGLI